MTDTLTPDAPTRMGERERLDRLTLLPTAVIGDVMDRLGLMHSGIKPVWAGATLVGRAFTIWTRAGDNKTIHDALPAVQADEVLVVNGEGDVTRALIGELIGRRAQRAGVAGFVIDGAVRDAGGLAELGVPVFARAVTPAGPYKFGPGRIQVPVAVGGLAVLPGDYIVGDEDGVVVITPEQVESVIVAAEAKHQNEIDMLAAMAAPTSGS